MITVLTNKDIFYEILIIPLRVKLHTLKRIAEYDFAVGCTLLSLT